MRHRKIPTFTFKIFQKSFEEVKSDFTHFSCVRSGVPTQFKPAINFLSSILKNIKNNNNHVYPKPQNL